MKLLYCPRCEDVMKLQIARGPNTRTACRCLSSYGYYKDDGIHAVYGGEAVPLGFGNRSLARAIQEWPLKGERGWRFDAFTIPVDAPTIEFEKSE